MDRVSVRLIKLLWSVQCQGKFKISVRVVVLFTTDLIG